MLSYGYMLLAVNLKKNPKLNGEAFNFGPDKNLKVIDVISKIKNYWPEVKWKIKKNLNFKEHNLLHLNNKKSKRYLKWSSNLNFNNSIKFTVQWYKDCLKNKRKSYLYSSSQILKYQEFLKNKF